MDTSVEEALQYIDPNIPRDDWVRVGMAIKSECGEAGFPVFDEWSRGGQSYKQADVQSTWRSIDPNGKTRIGTLYHMAKLYGYSPSKAMSEAEKARLAEERQRNAERIQQEYLEAEAKKCEQQELVALRSADRWEQAQPADPEHGYLKAKGVLAHNLRQEGENLLVPMFDEHNRIWSVQTISPAGEKRFPKDSRKKGMYYPVLGDKAGVVICEGFATGATLQEATGYFVAVAFDCGNLLPVAEMFRAKLPEQDIIIAADNDKAGISKASKAAKAINARMVVPEFPEGVEGTDFNDLEGVAGLDAVRKIVEEQDYRPEEPQPEQSFVFDGIQGVLKDIKAPSWTVRDYVEDDTHILLYGESESCKSFLMLNIALHVAAGMDWCGQPVRQGPVFYINGEGRGGFSRRIAAWCIANQKTEDLPFFVSRRPTRFYDEKAAQDVAEAIKALAAKHGAPVLVVIDTLAKNLGADENSNHDIAQYVRHVDELITRPFGCSVFTVHHVGHGEKTRARGAYALKADFDADMMVSRDKTVISDQVLFEPGKMKDGAPGNPLAFNIRVVDLGIEDEWGRQVNSIVLEQAEYAGRGKKQGPTKQEQLAIQTLEEAFRQHQRIPPREVMAEPANRLNAGRNVCPVSEWRTIYIARKSDDRTKPDSAERSFRRHVDNLQVKKIIKVFEEWVWFLEG